MKKLYPSLFINLCMLLAGIALIYLHEDENFMRYVALVLGIIFIVPSLAYVFLVCFTSNKNSEGKERRSSVEITGLLPSSGGFCFGIVLLLHPEIFAHALGIIFSILLICLGLFHIIYNYVSSSRCDIKPWYNVAPAIILMTGLATLLIKQENHQLLILCTGISFILSSFSGMLTYFAERKAVKKAKTEKIKTDAENAETKEIKPE